MFRESYFGAYVKMLTGVECHLFLYHFLMCKGSFYLYNYRVSFDMKAFCLITDLHFKDYFILTSSSITCISICVAFTLVIMADVMHVFNNLLHQLDDVDIVERHLNPTQPRFGSRHTYTVHRFVYAFKTFTNSSIVGSPISGVIPRIVA
uniref:Uncharacterized protein n=1 Tax=Lactuca sativa TaxID=4236 RepID=A0A9R1X4Q5_LACSA|nr:hypothetical protein LSAT_V11C600331050 [Lactuca sativa]